MKKISTKQDCERLCGLPPPVLFEIEKTVALLNFYYGEMRNPDTDLGGYVLLIEKSEELNNLKKIFHQEIDKITPEFLDIIRASEESYASAQIQLSSDFSVVLVMALSITPPHFLRLHAGTETPKTDKPVDNVF